MLLSIPPGWVDFAKGQADMKVLVVLNPGAGQTAHEAVREALDVRFRASHIEYEIHETRKTQKVGEIVRARLAEGFDLVVAAGGDGTVSDVIDGLVGVPKPLGIIPTGTGNLIARELGIPQDVVEAIEVIASAPGSRRIDAMRIGQRVFVLNASVGISASVIGSTTREHKRRFGRVAYFGTTLLNIFAFRSRTLVVAVDGLAHEYRAVEAAILNCGMLAKSLHPKGPAIRIDDGHLDVWILGPKAVRDYPRYLGGILRGQPVDLARYIKAERTVTIRSNVPISVQADGDIIGTTPLEIELLPGAVTVLVPTTPEVPESAAPGGARVIAPSQPLSPNRQTRGFHASSREHAVPIFHLLVGRSGLDGGLRPQDHRQLAPHEAR